MLAFVARLLVRLSPKPPQPQIAQLTPRSRYPQAPDDRDDRLFDGARRAGSDVDGGLDQKASDDNEEEDSQQVQHRVRV